MRHNVVDSHLITVDLAFQSGALLLDLSDLGMGVQALSSAPIGTTTTVRFDLPESGGRVDGVGRITWTDSSGRLGIRFEELADLSKVHLAQWLARDRRPSVAAVAKVAPTWPPLYERDEIAALRRDLITEKLEGDAALSFVVERIRNVTRATGAAIALEEGGAVVCRATSGNAPGVGARLDPNSGLSGDCIRTGEIVRCEDTETDPRADRLICRKLELRSMVIVPIRIQGRPAGVLEAFSSRSHAFRSGDVLLLRRVSDLVAGIAIRQPDAAPPSITGPQALMAATTVQPLMPEPLEEIRSPLMMSDILEDAAAVIEDAPEVEAEVVSPFSLPMETMTEAPAEPAPVESVAAPAPAQETAPPPMVIKPASAFATAAATTVSERPRPATAERPLTAQPAESFASAPTVVTRVERPAPPVPLVERHAPSAAVTARVETPAAPQTRPDIPATRTSPVERDIVAAPLPPPSAVRPMGMAASAAAAARPRPVPANYEYEHDTDREDATPVDDELLASIAQLPKPWRLRITGGAILLAVLVIGGWQVWRAVAPPKGTPMDSEMRQIRSAAANLPAPTLPSSATSATPSPVTTIPVSIPPIPIPGPKPSVPATKPAATVAAPKNLQPAANADAPKEIAKAEVSGAPPAMGLGVRPANSLGISSVLAAPIAPPTLDRPVVSEMTGGKLLKRYDPIYPKSATGLHGEVVLTATINKDGLVSRVQIVKGQAALAQAAAIAVKQWRYEPFRLNGVPIEIENTIVVNFKAPGQ